MLSGFKPAVMEEPNSRVTSLPAAITTDSGARETPIPPLIRTLDGAFIGRLPVVFRAPFSLSLKFLGPVSEHNTVPQLLTPALKIRSPSPRFIPALISIELPAYKDKLRWFPPVVAIAPFTVMVF